MPATRKGQHYRHTPAFLLLLLAQNDSYGAALLNQLEQELPAYRADSAIVYRSLQDLVKAGDVEQFLADTDGSGPVKKWYRITAKGRARLREYRDDIAERKRNLDYFLQTYERLFDGEA